MNVEKILKSYDGKNVTPFRDVAALVDPSATTMRRMIALAGADDPRLEIGATWVVKHWLEHGHAATATQTRDLLRRVRTVNAVDARLHLLQTIGFLKIPPRERAPLHRFLLKSSEAQNKFIRAWAYNGLGVLAIQYPERHGDEVTELFDRAMKTEAKSVQARIRNLRKGQGR